MRAHKLLFLIFLVLYFIAGLCLLITGAVAHNHAKKYAEITGSSLVGGAGFIIALGIFILFLTFVGFYAAMKNKLNLLTAFIVSLFLILLLQLIAAIVAFTLRGRAEEKLASKLTSTMHQYNGNSGVRTEWDRLQQTWQCCGVDAWQNWNATIGRVPPSSCCVNNTCTHTASNDYFQRGCLQYAKNIFNTYGKALGGVALFFFFVEIIGLILAIMLLRDLKHNYNSV